VYGQISPGQDDHLPGLKESGEPGDTRGLPVIQPETVQPEFLRQTGGILFSRRQPIQGFSVRRKDKALHRTVQREIGGSLLPLLQVDDPQNALLKIRGRPGHEGQLSPVRADRPVEMGPGTKGLVTGEILQVNGSTGFSFNSSSSPAGCTKITFCTAVESSPADGAFAREGGAQPAANSRA